MSEHRNVSNQEFFRIRDQYISIWGEPLRSVHFAAIKEHIDQYHIGLEGEERLAQVASHQAALMVGQITLRDLRSQGPKIVH